MSILGALGNVSTERAFLLGAVCVPGVQVCSVSSSMWVKGEV